MKTISQISKDFISAPIGATTVYHVGSLMRECEPPRGKPTKESAALQKIREYVWEMYLEGRVCLTQRKLNDREWEYRMTKREKKN